MFAADELEDKRDAAERTQLAWTRSGLALLGCFAILGKRVWTDGARGGDALAVVLLAFGALMWAVGVLSLGFIHRGGERARASGQPGELRMVALGTIAVAVAGFVITFVNV